jgi:hypothetical protein
MAGSRGPSYPAFGLPEAIERARKLYEQDGRAQTSPEVAVGAWGYGSLNGASLRVLSALKQYGLLETANDYVKLSDRALAIIVEPEGSPDRAEAIQAAAMAPAIFTSLLAEYQENVPSDGALVAHLVRKQGFSDDAAQKVVAAFRQTVELAKQSTVVHTTESRERPQPAAEHPRPGPRPESRGRHSEAPQRGAGEEAMEFNWPLSGNAVATLTVSKKLDLDDIETLTSYFEVAKRALKKAASTPASAITTPQAEAEAVSN